MKKWNVILDFTSLLDVTLIIIFFLSSVATMRARKIKTEQMRLYCVMDNDDKLCCTARLLRKAGANVPLPIENEYEIDLNLFEAENIYEFARFASNGEITFNTIEKMFSQMIQTVDIENSFVFASLDMRVYKGLVHLGYPIYKIGSRW